MTMFINPYNFIPLGNKTGDERERQERETGTYTGVIEYSVLTKTPLFIPNTSCDERFVKRENELKDHKSYDFFSYQDLSEDSSNCSGEEKCERPVIPGSEMRGMIRSIYEIMTDSCLSALDEDVVLSKRTAEVFQAGLIRRVDDKTFNLYEAEDWIWRTKGANSSVDEMDWKDSYYTRECYKQDKFPEGSRVEFTRMPNRGRGKPVACNVKLLKSGCRAGMEGYIIKGEPGPEQKPSGNRPSPQKHCCHIFRLKGNQAEPLKKGLTQELGNLEKLLGIYEKNKENPHEGYQEYIGKLNSFLKGDGEEYFPVYYSRENKFFWLSPASITREIYNNKLGNLAGKYKGCSQKEELCPACSLFGMLKDKSAVSSSLRFSDLECKPRDSYEKCFEPVTTLYPLSSPRLNNMEFYVRRPKEAVFWTYDYYIDAKGIFHENNPKLNGRKFYWHQLGKKLPSGVEKSGQNITIRPLKKDITFNGKLYFQKITKPELDRLIWILNGGEKAEISKKQYGYRLGAAKPLGLGSIAARVDNVSLRKVKVHEEGRLDICEEEYQPNTNIYEKEYLTDEKRPLFLKEKREQFQICMAFDAVKSTDVQYPCTYKNKGKDGFTSEEGYSWFVSNHVTRTRRMTQKRKEMCYGEYMEPMIPELKKVEELQQIREDFKKRR